MFDMDYQANSVMQNQQMLNSRFSNLQNQFTPGYKAETTNFQDMVTGYGGRSAKVSNTSIDFSQGPITQTGKPTNLALEGNGFFLVNDGNRTHYTRDGRFQIGPDGHLVNPEGLKVMGYQLDAQGNISSEQQPINMAFDPQTKLYGGKYASFHFDRSGKLYGVQKTINPLTNKVVERTVPLYQVAIGSFANPSALKKSGNSTFVSTENSGQAVVGTAGQGSLGYIHPGALEMSNVDFAREAAAIGMSKQNYEANFAAFKAMDKLRQSAISLVK